MKKCLAFDGLCRFRDFVLDRGEHYESAMPPRLALVAIICGRYSIFGEWAESSLAAAPARLPSAKANADRQAKEWLARGIPGLAMAVASMGNLSTPRALGYADLEERVPVWPTTKFRIGSISKPLTATALMELVEAGKVDLDAPVQKYVPSFPDKGAVITVRMLAGHLGRNPPL